MGSLGKVVGGLLQVGRQARLADPIDGWAFAAQADRESLRPTGLLTILILVAQNHTRRRSIQNDRLYCY